MSQWGAGAPAGVCWQRGDAMILVVEDDPQVARLISLVLQRNGEKSEVISDGAAALERAKTLKPSLIFADLTIKGMGGDALCSALKEHPETKDIPYIVLSGDRDIADKARHCGADDYMGKPFEFDDLIRLVKKYARA
jgi:two-component system, OmpR family, response regulator MtrA